MPNDHYVIVVADDDPYMTDLLNDLLSEEGYDVLCCFSGAEATSVIQRIVPNLVVTDMQMETPNAGMEVVERLRHDPRTAHISVILLSADTNALARHRIVIEQHDGKVMAKPFEIETLLSTIERLIMSS